MAYLHPGVYIEEIPSGSRPIEGVGTSTAAFVGYTTKGPIGEPELILKWDDYDKQYGGIRDSKSSKGDPMGFSVSAFFQNGGTKAYIVRVTQDWNKDDNPVTFDAKKAVGYLDDPSETAGDHAIRFAAVNEGEWGNKLVVRMVASKISTDLDPLYDVQIGSKNNEGDFESRDSFDGVSMDPKHAMFIKKVVEDKSELVTVDLVSVTGKTIESDSYMGTSTGGELTGVSLDFSGLTTAADRELKVSIDGKTEKTITLATKNYAGLRAVADEIQKEVRALDASVVAYTGFTCVAENDRLVLASGTRETSSSVVVDNAGGIAPTLKLGVKTVPFTDSSTSGDLSGLTLPLPLSDATAFPDADSRTLKGAIDGTDFTPLVLPAVVDIPDLPGIATAISGIAGLACAAVGNQLVLTSDSNDAASSVVIESDFGIAPMLKLGVAPTDHGGAEIAGQQYHDANLRVEVTGQQSADAAWKSGKPSEDGLSGGADGSAPLTDDYTDVFTKFIKYRDINTICLPGQAWAGDGTGNPVIDKAIGHASKMKSRMVIVDPPADTELETPKGVIDLTLPSKTYSVLYYPWINVANPFYNAEKNPGAPRTVLVPPSGYAAGMWAKIDGKRGVWKAPAGLESGLLGVAGLQYVVEDGEQDSLNPLGVNCLRKMPGAGPVIWGARTLATKADPEWRYVPVRRTAIMIEQSIYRGIQWAVFEPNDHRLWAALRGNIGGFMNSLFRVGAFQGEKASDAYFVRCGKGDTMTQAEIDAGQVIVIVGFAPLKPAEFVIVRIQQKVNLQ